MKKTGRKLLSLLFCMALALTMCLALGGSVYAADEPTQLNSGSTIAPVQISNINNIDTERVYSTPPIASTSSEDFTYSINMPKKGTLFFFYAPSAGASCYISDYTGATYAGSGTEDSVDYTMYYVPSAGSVKVTLRAYGAEGGYGVFSAYYIPASKTVKAGKSAVLGSSGSSDISTLKVEAPSTGYLKIIAVDGYSSYSYVGLNTKGFKSWEYLSDSNNNTIYIGVKKGTYSIKLKGAKLYDVKTKFVSVKETSKKTTKSKAASLTKNKINKGVIVANNKKVHWYKIKNPKNQKMSLQVSTKKMTDGGSYGSLKMTIYYPNKTTRSTTVEPGLSGPIEIYYGTIGTKKARAGTYFVKVESTGGGNGYYTLKWK